MKNKEILKEIYLHKNKNRAKSSAWYFKTGKGEYGEGDKFLGLIMDEQRGIAKTFLGVGFEDIKILLKSIYHEERMIGLLILVYKYKKADKKLKKKIFDFYLKNTKYINNWDLVDLSASHVLGDYLSNENQNVQSRILNELINSKSLWEQRIAIISTFAFIKKGEMKWSIKIAKMFLNHKHDLIHKAVGWMLREVGKKDEIELYKFLNTNIHKMPRTMLRYSIEKFPEHIRKEYLKK